MAGLSPTELTLRKLRQDGWPLVQVVERWVPFPKPGHRADLFGFVDVLAAGPQGTIAIQATAYGNVSARLAKARDERATEVAAMLTAGWQVHVWGWRKQDGRWKLGRDVDLAGIHSNVMHTTTKETKS